MKTTIKTATLSYLAAGILFTGSSAVGEQHGAAAHGSASPEPAPTSHAKEEPKPAENIHDQIDSKQESKAVPAAPIKSDVKAEGPTADEVIDMLRNGNRRFASGDSIHPRNDQDRRSETYSGGQHPIVSLLSCADSRVPPELIFDAGIGDLFVIRVAGNVADTDEIATIEYGAGHLKTPLIMVMGHTKCGAVAAVVDGVELHGNLAELTENIHAPATRVKDENPSLKGQSLNNKVIRANVFQSIQDLLQRSDEVRELVETKKVKIVGAVYDINSGFIDWLGEHPRQAEILSTPSPETAGHGEKMTDSAKDSHAPANTHGSPKKDAHANTKEDAHSSALKKTGDNKTPAAKSTAKTTEVSMLKTYGPIGAFAIGSFALSAVFLHLVRK